MDEVKVCVNKEILKSTVGENLDLNQDGNYSEMKCNEAGITDLVNGEIVVVNNIKEEDEENAANDNECDETRECFDTVEALLHSREIEENSESINESKIGENSKWTTDATKLLISAVNELTPMVGKTVELETKKQMWIQISKMLEENLYMLSPVQCKNRWTTLRRGFKDKIKSITATGRATLSNLETMMLNRGKIGLRRKKTSVIWRFFTPVNDKESICNFCKQKIKYIHSITNMKIHIKRKHPTIKMERAQTNRMQSLEKQTSTSSFHHIDAKVKLETSASSSPQPIPSITQLEPSIIDPLQPLKKVGSTDKKELDGSLLKFITKDFQPVSIVEEEGFREFCSKLNPSYEIPSRKLLANILLPAKYLEVFEQAKNVINDAVSVTITIDTWTSCNNDSFLAVSAHFIDSNFISKSVLLETCDLTVQDTNSNITSVLRRVVTEWGLQDKILLAVTDQKANIKKVITEDLQWQHFGCLARTIDSIVRDGLKPLKSIMDKVKDVASHFKKSLVAKTELERYQKQSGKEPKKILQAAVTRWSSEFYMLERVIELKEDIQATLTSNRKKDLPILTNEDFDIFNEVMEVLAPMEAVTKNMSRAKYVTASSVIIIIMGLKEVYQSLSEDLGYSVKVKEVINIINNGLQEKFGPVESNNTLLISTFLDPRFKNIGFSSEEIGDQARTLVINILTNLIEKQSQPIKVDPQTVGMSSEKRKKYDYWRSFDKKKEKFQPISTSRSRAFIEVQRYLEEPPLNRDLCPLSWWKINGYNYPNLSKLVREKFGTVATSVSCEQLFSKSGQILSDRRNRLSSTNVKHTMFINKNS